MDDTLKELGRKMNLLQMAAPQHYLHMPCQQVEKILIVSIVVKILGIVFRQQLQV